MELKAGSRWRSAVCDTEVIVVRAPKSSVVLSCGGQPMLPAGSPPPSGAQLDGKHAAGTLIGKRYQDAASALEVLCAKPGRGSLAVNGASMTQKETKALPASD